MFGFFLLLLLLYIEYVNKFMCLNLGGHEWAARCIGQ
jgi:hypothetical protein